MKKKNDSIEEKLENTRSVKAFIKLDERSKKRKTESLTSSTNVDVFNQSDQIKLENLCKENFCS